MSDTFTEVEWKFLVWPVPHEKLTDSPRRSYKQGYVVTGDTEVRIRCDLDGRGERSYRLAVKRGLGYVRDEVEVPVPMAEGEKLFELAGNRVITKTRYQLPNGWTLDELHGPLEGMWILEHEHEIGSTVPPRPELITVMMDVTDRPAFKTQQLAERVAAR